VLPAPVTSPAGPESALGTDHLLAFHPFAPLTISYVRSENALEVFFISVIVFSLYRMVVPQISSDTLIYYRMEFYQLFYKVAEICLYVDLKTKSSVTFFPKRGKNSFPGNVTSHDVLFLT
jgi:hypothetical protein